MHTFHYPPNVCLKQKQEPQSGVLTLLACAQSQAGVRYLTLDEPQYLSCGDLKALQSSRLLNAKLAECFIKAQPDGSCLVLLGVGQLEKVTCDTIRHAFCEGARFALRKGFTHIQYFEPYTCTPSGPQRNMGLSQAALEGLLLGQMPIGGGADKKGAYFSSLTVIGRLPDNHEDICTIAYANLLTRALVNANADEMSPSRMANIAQQIVEELKPFADEQSDLSCKVLKEDDIRNQGLGLVEAVSRGASEPPRVIILAYNPPHSSESPILLVGKGISYDTGGLKLKPAESMLYMRSDMAGAACVLAAFQAAVKKHIKTPLVAIIAAAENAIGPNSYKLGDVYTSYSSKTVEITNTDAEGRLVLADAISYGIAHFRPRCIIDVATLTGVAILALGHEAAAIMSNSKELADLLQQASEESGERLWPLPIYEEYFEALKSDIADMKNSGPRQGACCIAASFIKQFVHDVPWAHLDIAPTAFLEKDKGTLSKFATGFGARLLLSWLSKY